MTKIPDELLKACHKNAATRRARVKSKLEDIASRIPRLPSPITEVETIVYRSANDALVSKLAVSINLRLERFVHFVAGGILPFSVPSSSAERKFRTRAESCFETGAVGQLIYGALHMGSTSGGAPGFGPDTWLEIDTSAIKARCTLTLRDSYTIIQPFFDNYIPAAGRTALSKEIFLWEGIVAGVLDKWWVFPDAEVNDYIEVQIWGSLALDEISWIHVRTSMMATLRDQVLALKDGHQKWLRIKPQIVNFG